MAQEVDLPQHVVIVPDGNRRWAKRRGEPSYFGHRAGAKTTEMILKSALDSGVQNLTIWGSSVSNVTERSESEVKFLFQIFEQLFRKLRTNKDVKKHAVRVQVLGRWEELFPDGLKKIIRAVIAETKDKTGPRLTILMAYSGVDEMTNAVKAIAESVRRDPDTEVCEHLVKEYLWTRDLPPVDLVIRTGGEPHWSAGMLMWDVAEARLYFTKTLWPDFSGEEFQKTLESYSRTERRHGK